MKTQVYLTPKDRGRALSLEEFVSAGGQEGYHYELIEGKLEVSPLPNFPHDFIRKWLERRLDDYADRHPEILDYVQAPSRVFVPGRAAGTTPEPDVAGYRDFPEEPDVEQLNWQDGNQVAGHQVARRQLGQGTCGSKPVRLPQKSAGRSY